MLESSMVDEQTESYSLNSIARFKNGSTITVHKVRYIEQVSILLRTFGSQICNKVPF